MATAVIAMFTSAVSAIIMTASNWAYAQSTAEQLLVALDTRDTISTAKGIVMARLGLNDDESFQWMVEVSKHANRKVLDLATVIVVDPALVHPDG